MQAAEFGAAYFISPEEYLLVPITVLAKRAVVNVNSRVTLFKVQNCSVIFTRSV